MDTPIFLLASPRSYSTIIGAMLGNHPEIHGMPELNLFIAADVKGYFEAIGPNQFLSHGLLRAVAQVFKGEQTSSAVAWSRSWLERNGRMTTTELFHWLREQVSPSSILDKSPAYVVNPHYLSRIRRACPEARYLHIVRHPLTQGASILTAEQGYFLKLQADYAESTVPANGYTPDQAWLANQINILAFLEGIPHDQQLTLRAEAVMQCPDSHLSAICAWLGKRHDPEAVDSMLHPERGTYAGLGPPGAPFGNAIEFLKDPVFRRLPDSPAPSLLKSPGWLDNGRQLGAETVALAKRFGYM